MLYRLVILQPRKQFLPIHIHTVHSWGLGRLIGAVWLHGKEGALKW